VVEATASMLVVNVIVVVDIVVEVDDVVTADPVWPSAIFKIPLIGLWKAPFFCVTGLTCWAHNGKGLSIKTTVSIPVPKFAMMRSKAPQVEKPLSKQHVCSKEVLIVVLPGSSR